MKVFIDTNVILEYFEKYEVAEKLLKELRNKHAQMLCRKEPSIPYISSS